jgi:prepilin-type N-terminal cleavage/methylation domain-containing protein
VVFPHHRAHRSGSAFTLIELLVVVAIIAVLSALITPAVQGLMGTSGRRGALNTVTAVLEQARLSAIENGTTAYVGFPYNAANKTNGYSHLIVFRDARPGDTNSNPVAVTRWQRLPNGVFLQGGTGLSGAVTTRTLPTRTLPRLGGSEDLTQIPALAFNRFGQLQGASTAVSVLLGEKIEPTGDWRGSPNNYYELRIQPLTGRVIVDDASL